MDGKKWEKPEILELAVEKTKEISNYKFDRCPICGKSLNHGHDQNGKCPNLSS